MLPRNEISAQAGQADMSRCAFQTFFTRSALKLLLNFFPATSIDPSARTGQNRIGAPNITAALMLLSLWFHAFHLNTRATMIVVRGRCFERTDNCWTREPGIKAGKMNVCGIEKRRIMMHMSMFEQPLCIIVKMAMKMAKYKQDCTEAGKNLPACVMSQSLSAAKRRQQLYVTVIIHQ